MKLCTKLLFLFGLVIAFVLYESHRNNLVIPNYPLRNLQDDKRIVRSMEPTYDEIFACKTPNRTWTKSMPLSYRGSSLTSSHLESLILCPGDYFGDLNNTYFVMKTCSLEMYNKDQMIWSSKKGISPFNINEDQLEYHEACAFYLGTDGNIGLYYGFKHDPDTDIEKKAVEKIWSFGVYLNLLRTELRVQDQQFQILQTFKDGTQRSFYLTETHPIPKKVGSSGFVKNHTDKIPTILQKNEYIGDLDGLYLILQTDCELHLFNQNRSIWYFRFPDGSETSCSLIVQEDKWISLSKITTKDEETLSILGSLQNLMRYFQARISGDPSSYQLQSNPKMFSIIETHSFKVLESQFLLKDDQLFIIQILEDGSNRTFSSEQGENNKLKLQKEPRQIVSNNFTTTIREAPFVFQQMAYIGNLQGLHLILHQNCTFMLANGPEKLWQWKFTHSEPCLDCFITLFSNESSKFSWVHTNEHISTRYMYGMYFPSGFQLILDNNNAIITIHYEKHNRSVEYYAGPNTRGDWLRRISESSVVIKAVDKSDIHLPERAYIGDINGVYVMFEDDCNWILYNKSQILWQSGTSKPGMSVCMLYLKRDGTLAIPYKDFIGYGDFGAERYKKGELWSTKKITKNIDPSKKLLTSELSVSNDWLWLTNTFKDGTVQKFKALEGTNTFVQEEIMHA